MTPKKISMAIFALAFIASPFLTHAQATITATGTVYFSLSASDLRGGAGADFIDTYESDPYTVFLTITAIESGEFFGNWRVEVRRADSFWDNSVNVFVRRVDDGTGNGTVSGGMEYQEITAVDQSFFTGNKNRDSIHIQFKISGVSVQVSPGEYMSEVSFTVVDLLL